jgi:hypothetical protein
MKVLIACEYSGTVRDEFIKLGHDAISCDLLPTDKPGPHYQGDLFDVVNNGYDKVISFQPCTDLALSGARWFSEKRANGNQEKSIRLFFEVWKVSNCSENPIGIMNGGKYIKQWFPELWHEMKDYGFPFMPTQIIQPWQFGHGETKATCLWLKGLPKLKHSNIVQGREQRIWKMPPSPDRWKLRSKTFTGIAEAMANQWTNIKEPNLLFNY